MQAVFFFNPFHAHLLLICFSYFIVVLVCVVKADLGNTCPTFAQTSMGIMNTLFLYHQQIVTLHFQEQTYA